MRHFLFIMALSLSLIAKAQITSELSFDNKTKTVLLKLKNETGDLIFLFPRSGQDDKEATYYTIEYKDVNGKMLHSFETYVFDFVSGNRFLLPGKAQTYKLDLSTKKVADVFSVEVRLHIEAHNSKRTLLIKDINQSYRWQ